MTYYYILSGPRTGSTWLCRLLSETRVLGRPAEHYLLPQGERVIDTNNKTQQKFLSKEFTDDLIDNRSTPNNIFGAKGSPFGLRAMRSHLEPVQVIFLQRRDVIMQAISFYLRDSNNDWKTEQSAKIKCEDIKYDNTGLFEAYSRIVLGNSARYNFCAINHIYPLSIYYEDLYRDPTSWIQYIGNYIGVSVDIGSIDRYEGSMLRTQGSYEWKDIFIKENIDKINPAHIIPNSLSC